MTVKQTGLLVRAPSMRDYLMGGYTRLVAGTRIQLADWSMYLPTNEKQHNYTFDTLSCATFSALNIVENQINWMVSNGYMDLNDLQWLNENGYIDINGKFNCSDRFTAIMSGTTKQGNYLPEVWGSMRVHGLLPEKDLPFGNCKTWEEYHDKTKITEAMKAKAKKMTEFLDVVYEWVFYKYQNEPLTDAEKNRIDQALQQAPLHIGIAYPATHAVTMYSNDRKILDQYEPYTSKYPESSPIHFGIKGYVSLKEKPLEYIFTKSLSFGMTDKDVIVLQKFLNTDIETRIGISGAGSPRNETNYFGGLTKNAVMRFQKKYGLTVDGVFGTKSIAKSIEVQKKNLK